MITITTLLEWLMLAVIGIVAKSLYSRSIGQERRIDSLETRMDVLKQKQKSDVTLLENKIDSLRKLNEQKLEEILHLLELTKLEIQDLKKCSYEKNH
jgi:hypothetical protein